MNLKFCMIDFEFEERVTWEGFPFLRKYRLKVLFFRAQAHRKIQRFQRAADDLWRARVNND